jgi:hypothetical protein
VALFRSLASGKLLSRKGFLIAFCGDDILPFFQRAFNFFNFDRIARHIKTGLLIE